MKKLTAFILICMLIMVGCGDSDSTGNKALDGDLDLESNQSLVIAQVTAIYGNEITLAIAEKVDVSATNISKTNESSKDTSKTDANENINTDTSAQDTAEAKVGESNTTDSVEAGSDTANITDTKSSEASTEGNMPTSGEVPSGGNIPSDGETPSGGMPSGGEAPSTGDMPTSDETSSVKGSSGTETSDKEQSQMQVTRYTLTGEEMTATIPVGTPVTTLLGTVTTFSRIAVENTLQIVTEKNSDGEDVIVAIYIVG